MSCLWSVHGQVEIRGKSLIQDRVQRQDQTNGLWGRLVGPHGSTDVLATKSSALQLGEGPQAAQDPQKAKIRRAGM